MRRRRIQLLLKQYVLQIVIIFIQHLPNGGNCLDHSFQDDRLYNQIEDTFGKVLYTQTTQVKASVLMKKRDHTIKWMSVILSVITTDGLLGYFVTNIEYCLLFSVMTSMVMVMLSSMMKSIDYNSLSEGHKKAADELLYMREKYLSLLVDYPLLSRNEVMERRDLLMRELSEIYKKSPTTDRKSYTIAKKAIESGEQLFTDNDLNNIIPPSLRKGCRKT